MIRLASVLLGLLAAASPATLARTGVPAMPQDTTTPKPAQAGAALEKPLFPPGDAEGWLSLALVQEREGRYAEALATVGRIRCEPGSPIEGRLLREKKRITSYQSLRNEFLERARAESRPIAFEHDGTRYSGIVESVGESELTLRTRRQGAVKVSLRAFAPYPLLKAMGPWRTKMAPQELIAHCCALSGDQRSFKKCLRGISEDLQKRLSTDTARYEEELRLGEASCELLALASAASRPAAAKVDPLPLLRELLAHHAKSRVVSGHRDCLCMLARKILARAFDAECRGKLPGVHAKVEALEGNRLRIHYDFEDAAQEADWPPVEKLSNYPVVDSISGIPPEKSTSGIKRGALVTLGTNCRRNVLSFQGPLRLQYKFRYESPPRSKTSVLITTILGFFADGRGSFVAIHSEGIIHLFNRDRNVSRCTKEEARTLPLGKIFTYELEHDGENPAVLKIDGTEQTRLDLSPMESGHVFWWTGTETPVQLHEVTIEGTLDRACIRTLCESWTAKQLAELGLE